MKRAFSGRIVGLTAVALLAASAAPGSAQEKKGSARVKAAEAASARCWKEARAKRVPEGKASENQLSGFLMGGLVGVAVARSMSIDEYQQALHDRCMKRQGYGAKKKA